MNLLDTIAELSISPDQNFDEIQQFFNEEKRLQPPANILARYDKG